MLSKITPYIFFTGKGGVGKTTLACATAVKLADEGNRVLLISTDPASNLGDVLQSNVNDKVQPIEGVSGLEAINIDPEIAAEEYRNRTLEPLEDVLGADQLNKIREELSGACTTEIAAFDEFSRFVAGEHEGEDYDIVVFDTAPTGHTLRLLELPAAWSSFIDKNPEGASCLGPTSSLKSSKELYEKVVSRLRDGDATTVYLVSRPETSALKEAARSSRELDDLGLSSQLLLINGYFEPLDLGDPVALEMKKTADQAIEQMPESIQHLDREIFPLRPYNILGIDKLRKVFEPLEKDEIMASHSDDLKKEPLATLPGLNDLIEDLTRQDHGLIMTMGKGGVGKTSVAVAVALKLADKGYPVHLTTTDPAAHLMDHLGDKDAKDHLTVDRIDPKKETQNYIEKVMSQKGKNMDEEGRKLLREDLESPCTEEVAVFHAFSKAIQKAKRQFVVVDTAPTGHTLLLLDTAGSYHREIMRNTNMDASHLKTPYMYLQDPEHSRLLIVTLPETTPVNEAAHLQEDLRRADIEPYGWIVNQSLSATEVSDPLLVQRAKEELPILETIQNEKANQLYSIPWIHGDSVAHSMAFPGEKELA
ncbi:MAG: arsenical pump-driving ATPase [Balneolaceae bacterium]|nr:arsenical pump-driving ATPase [Balneolaceae bacterium]